MAKEPRQIDLFSEASRLPSKDEILVSVYTDMRIPLDRLFVSDELRTLVQRVQEQGDTRSPEELKRRLLNLRKAGRLPRLGTADRPIGNWEHHKLLRWTNFQE
jgi:hypothetical protein